MSVLLDTHALVWWWNEPERLSKRARVVFEEVSQPLLWSSVSTAEVANKIQRGLLVFQRPFQRMLRETFSEEHVVGLTLEHHHAIRLATLPRHHRDPFDRLLIAQAQVEGVAIVTKDPWFRAYDVEVVW